MQPLKWIWLGSRFRKVTALLAGLLLSALVTESLKAADVERTNHKLSLLQQELKQLQQAFAAASREKNSLREQLRDSEQQAAKVSDALAGLKQELSQLEQQYGQADQRVSALRQQRDLQAEALAVQLRDLFARGEQDALKLLLSQDSPQRMARMLRYQRYLSDSRQQAIRRFDATLVELRSSEQTLNEKRDQLTQRQQQLDVEQTRLLRLRSERGRALAKLEKTLTARQDRIAALQEDQKQLKQILQTLQKALVARDLEVSNEPFKGLKGKLPWPTSGKIRRAYGSRDNGVALEGVVIGAREGEPIRAVHTGRVVYSDWLRGYGLLLVVDHGEGYLTLYGHNQSLLKEVGDWVSAGESIGRVGDSGGQDAASLYFAIRRNGRPIDPVSWLR